MTAHDVVRQRITGNHLEGTGSPGFLNSVPVSDSQADVMKERGLLSLLAAPPSVATQITRGFRRGGCS